MSDASRHYHIQISTASVSLTASVVLVSMITLTPKRLSTPYRRLIFGMSVFDIIQSIGLITGPFSAPEGAWGAGWAKGTTALCEANGFLNYLGIMAVPIYTLALSVRFFCKLNLKMHDQVFSEKIEKWFHYSIIAVIILCFVALGMDTFNPLPSGAFCLVEEYPFNCRDAPYWLGECERGTGSETFTIMLIVIMLICFLGIILNVTMLCVKLIIIERMYRSRASDSHGLEESNCVRDYVLCVPCRNYNQLEHEPDADYVLRLYKKETFIQSLLYVGAFFACYSCPLLQTIGSFFNYQFPSAILYFNSIFYPLGGLFNVLTYTRPKVVRLRHAFPDFSRLRALLIVLKAGGELPDLEANPYALEINHCCMIDWAGMCNPKRRRTFDDSTPDSTAENDNDRVLFDMFASLTD